jgi:hypothetical protein
LVTVSDRENLRCLVLWILCASPEMCISETIPVQIGSPAFWGGLIGTSHWCYSVGGR